MVYTYITDPYNSEGRNSKNTRLCDYNCGGYALSTYNWFCSNTDSTKYYSLDINERVDYSIRYMIKFFGKDKIRVIHSVQELTKVEYAVAFRVGNCDFHYMKRGKNGVWYHKPGSNTIRRATKKEVFADKWTTPDGWTIYDSKIVLLAVHE